MQSGAFVDMSLNESPYEKVGKFRPAGGFFFD